MARYLIVLSILLGSFSAPVSGGEPEPPSALERTVTQLRQAFEQSSASALHRLLPTDRKVFLAVPAVNPQRQFLGSDQVYLLFRRFFENNETRAFRHGRFSQPETDELFLEATWSYTTGADQVVREQLLLLLVNEEGQWRLREIRTAGS